MSAPKSPPPPAGLVAELTHRCPLRCPYCSNPVELQRRSRELETDAWLALFEEAAALGVLQLHLTGGEPTARADLEALVAGAREAGLYTNLITSGVGLSGARLARLIAAGLDHVQLSLQGESAPEADRVAGLDGAHARKLALARRVAEAGVALTINAVLHRGNVEQVAALAALAAASGAQRLELAHAQYVGWAWVNRAALLPSEAQVKRARQAIEAARARWSSVLQIDHVEADHWADRPKACVDGWGRRIIVVRPDGLLMPCHGAASIPGLGLERAGARPLADVWRDNPGFARFRGVAWMPPACQRCPERHRDFGGCRCQALAALGDASATDPVCARAPEHAAWRAEAEALAAAPAPPFRYRSFGASG